MTFADAGALSTTRAAAPLATGAARCARGKSRICAVIFVEIIDTEYQFKNALWRLTTIKFEISGTLTSFLNFKPFFSKLF